MLSWKRTTLGELEGTCLNRLERVFLCSWFPGAGSIDLGKTRAALRMRSGGRAATFLVSDRYSRWAASNCQE